MSYQVVVPFGGYTGWNFLNRTRETQMAAFTASAANQTDEAYFRERIGNIDSAEALVADHRLLKVALGAFGLGDDIASKFFIRKVLEEGTEADRALANRLSNKQYAAMADTFGFGDTDGAKTREAGFADQILEMFRVRQFEIAVGVQDDSLRLALNAQRELPELAARGSSENTKWYSILGTPPLRTVMQTAFGLPAQFPAMDIDRQLSIMKEKSAALLGSADPAILADPDVLDKLLRTYLARSSAADMSVANSGAGAALQLLQAAGNQSNRLSLLL